MTALPLVGRAGSGEEGVEGYEDEMVAGFVIAEDEGQRSLSTLVMYVFMVRVLYQCTSGLKGFM